jgi:hypothetical protein
MTEQLLEDALRALTQGIEADLGSRSRIAAQLTKPVRPSRLAPALATAAAVVTLVAAVAYATSDVGAHSGESQFGASAGDSVPLAAAPLEARTDVPAYRRPTGGGEPELVYVRATTGEVVARVPAVGGDGATYPVLSPDGRRLYMVWNRGGTLGYLDVLTGRRQQLLSRPGQMVGVTISADGTTLAYEWVPTVNGDLSHAAVVVRDLTTGAERLVSLVSGVHAGPQALPLALSPDGSTLAMVPTDAFPRRLLLVRVATGTDAATAVPGAPCDDPRWTAYADQPRWTSAGLYFAQHCVPNGGSAATSDLVRVDVAAARAERVLRVTPVASTLLFTVVQDHSRVLFVTSDESQPESATVELRDPLHPATAHLLAGLSSLAVSSAE